MTKKTTLSLAIGTAFAATACSPPSPRLPTIPSPWPSSIPATSSPRPTRPRTASAVKPSAAPTRKRPTANCGGDKKPTASVVATKKKDGKCGEARVRRRQEVKQIPLVESDRDSRCGTAQAAPPPRPMTDGPAGGSPPARHPGSTT